MSHNRRSRKRLSLLDGLFVASPLINLISLFCSGAALAIVLSSSNADKASTQTPQDITTTVIDESHQSNLEPLTTQLNPSQSTQDMTEEQSPDDLATLLNHENPAVQRQGQRHMKYLANDDALNLNIPIHYFSQRDNYTMPHRTCNSSANAMYLDFLLRSSGQSGLDSDDSYLENLLNIGDTIYHHNQTQAIEGYGFQTKWMTDADLPFVKDLVKLGIPVPVNILHRGSINNPTGGHVILLIGKEDGYWIAHDPYGTLESNYSVTNGENSRISDEEFRARWQGGYRILR